VDAGLAASARRSRFIVSLAPLLGCWKAAKRWGAATLRWRATGRRFGWA